MVMVVFSGSNSKCEGNGNHTVVISGSYGSCHGNDGRFYRIMVMDSIRYCLLKMVLWCR